MVEFSSDMKAVHSALDASSIGAFAEWRGPGVYRAIELLRINK